MAGVTWTVVELVVVLGAAVRLTDPPHAVSVTAAPTRTTPTFPTDFFIGARG
jgi:hypothetical protein